MTLKLNLNQKWPVTPHKTWNQIDSSKIGKFLECPRLFFYEHVLGWRTENPSNHLIFGSAVHLAMEHLYKNGFSVSTAKDAINIFINDYRNTFPEATDRLFEPKTPDRFVEMLIEYVKYYPNDLTRNEVLYTEISGLVTIGDFEVIFKMDTILKDLETDKYFSLEHKTKGGPFYGDSWDNQWLLSPQIFTYTHALNCMFKPEDVSGITMNGLGFKKTKSYMFDFHRVPISKTIPQLQILYDMMISWISLIRSNFFKLALCSETDQTLKPFPLNHKACTNWSRTCGFFDYCNTWTNPLQHSHEPPLGFKTEYWNPLETHHTHSFDLRG